MALCVDLQAQEAMEEMREAVKQAPDSFIAHLKFGELLMRLRICDQAAEHTQKAAELACNDVQSDLARRQAATIRTMRREGVERGGFGGCAPMCFPATGVQKSRPILPDWPLPSRRDARNPAIGAADRHTPSCRQNRRRPLHALWDPCDSG